MSGLADINLGCSRFFDAVELLWLQFDLAAHKRMVSITVCTLVISGDDEALEEPASGDDQV